MRERKREKERERGLGRQSRGWEADKWKSREGGRKRERQREGSRKAEQGLGGR